MTNLNKLPNFLVIGPPKSASSWLYYCLKDHPDIFVPIIKEVHFFDKYYEKGLEWYGRYFRAVRHEKAIGEISPSYISYEPAAERIAGSLKNVRLVACLRDPAERAYSHYRYQYRKGVLACDFERALREKDHYVRHGRYYTHLQRFLKLFSRERILILFYEDLIADPVKTVQSIYRFLGVDDGFVPPSALKRLPPEHMSAPAFVAVSRFSVFARKRLGLGFLIDGLKRSPLLPLADRLLERYGHRVDPKKLRSARKTIPPFTESTHERLIEIFREENRQLAALLQRDLSRWEKSR